MTKRSILLVEPGYRNKYPPLGLMKLAAYHGPQGRGDHVSFVKGEDPQALGQAWDRVYVTTLFSFEWKRTGAAIDYAIRAANGQPERVFVGGISASLMHEEFVSEPRWAGVRFIKGLLGGPPAASLQLSAKDGEFGSGDLKGTPIEELTPNYSILDQVNYQYPVHDAYFGYASRGCVRKCKFCGVPKLEGAQRDMPPLSRLVSEVTEAYGEKKDLVLMDNNVTAAPRYREIIAEIRDLGFTPGATLKRNGSAPVKRRVDFNQGVDARILVKSPMFLREMSTICISPLRIAFDHVGMRKMYEQAVRMAAENLITSLSNYMLYNFMDSPADLYERMRLNIKLNEELGIRIWSFPMRYQPVTLKDRSHVGKKWNPYFLRSFQIMLQATRGIVSGSADFFERAYGGGREEFERLLTLPHAFIFHREHYERGPGKPVRDEYEAARRRLSTSQEQELVMLLSEAGLSAGTRRDNFRRWAADRTIDHGVREAISFHVLDTKDKIRSALDDAQRPLFKFNSGWGKPAEDEIVEDAGLFPPVAPSVDARHPMRPLNAELA
ncbi:MAG: radical SAM protein [Gammaproteobacteria bacterium]|nr:radical SAM protein [Gammaproteobacteria bacterium]